MCEILHAAPPYTAAILRASRFQSAVESWIIHNESIQR